MSEAITENKKFTATPKSDFTSVLKEVVSIRAVHVPFSGNLDQQQLDSPQLDHPLNKAESAYVRAKMLSQQNQRPPVSKKMAADHEVFSIGKGEVDQLPALRDEYKKALLAQIGEESAHVVETIVHKVDSKIEQLVPVKAV